MLTHLKKRCGRKKNRHLLEATRSQENFQNIIAKERSKENSEERVTNMKSLYNILEKKEIYIYKLARAREKKSRT